MQTYDLLKFALIARSNGSSFLPEFSPYNTIRNALHKQEWSGKKVERPKNKRQINKWHELHVGVMFSLSILFTVRLKHLASWKLCFSRKQTAEISHGLFPKPVGSTPKTSFPLRSDSTSSCCSTFKTNPKSLASPSKSTSFIFPRGFLVKLIHIFLMRCDWHLMTDCVRIRPMEISRCWKNG